MLAYVACKRLFWFAGQHDRISADRKASGTANDREMDREIEKCTRGPWPFWPNTS